MIVLVSQTGTHLRDNLVKSFNKRIAEWGMAALMALISFAMFQHDGILATCSCRDMLLTAPQETWMWVTALIGGGRLLVLLINGALSRSPHFRTFFSLSSGLFWLVFALSFHRAETETLGAYIFPILVGMDLFAAIRAAGEARIADDAKFGS